MSVPSYRGYISHVEYDPDDSLFVGHVVGVSDIVGFHGETLEELEIAFREAVDDYVEACGTNS